MPGGQAARRGWGCPARRLAALWWRGGRRPAEGGVAARRPAQRLAVDGGMAEACAAVPAALPERRWEEAVAWIYDDFF